MSDNTILLVEDEPHLARVIKESLEQRSYQVVHAADGREGLSAFQRQPFALCIVDVMMPGMDGFSLAKQIRATDARVAMLFLTARTATKDVIEGYASGGNDYLKKPFSLEELFLRVNELLKRSARVSAGAAWSIGSYKFNPSRQTLLFPGGEEVKLSYRETQMLQMLYEHRNGVLDRKKTLIALWGDDNYSTTRSMDVFITRLRKHLARDGQIEIINVRGLGYKLVC